MAETFHSSSRWAELRLALLDVVGEKGCLFDQQDTAAYCEDWRHLYKGRTPAVVRPASADEVAAVVRLCAERNFQIVPQGWQHWADGWRNTQRGRHRNRAFFVADE